MKRDIDLVRKILLAVEGSEDRISNLTGWGTPLKIDGYSAEQTHYHLVLLTESGLLTGDNCATEEDEPWSLYRSLRLTWDGHEFLDAARDDGNWEKAKGIAAKAGGWTLSILKDILVEIITGAITGR